MIYMGRTLLFIAFLIYSAVLHAQGVKKIKITDLEKTIQESKTPLIVNFWATFCKPCIEEIPFLEQLTQKNKVDLLLVSLDLEIVSCRAKKFYCKEKIFFTCGMAR